MAQHKPTLETQLVGEIVLKLCSYLHEQEVLLYFSERFVELLRDVLQIGAGVYEIDHRHGVMKSPSTRSISTLMRRRQVLSIGPSSVLEVRTSGTIALLRPRNGRNGRAAARPDNLSTRNPSLREVSALSKRAASVAKVSTNSGLAI